MGDFTVRFCRDPRKLLPRKLKVDIVDLKEASEEEVLHCIKSICRRHPFIGRIEYFLCSQRTRVPEQLRELPCYYSLKCPLKCIISNLLELNLLSKVFLASQGSCFYKENTVAICSGTLYLNTVKRTFEELGLTEGRSSKAKDSRHVTIIGYEEFTRQKKGTRKLLDKLSHHSLPIEYLCSFPECESTKEIELFVQSLGNAVRASNTWTQESVGYRDFSFPVLNLKGMSPSSESMEILTQLHDFLGLQSCRLPRNYCPWFENYRVYDHCYSGMCQGFVPGESGSNIFSDLSTWYKREGDDSDVLVVHFFDPRDSPVLTADVAMTISDSCVVSMVLHQQTLLIFDVRR